MISPYIILNVLLLSKFRLPLELRFIICDNYFPFFANEEEQLNPYSLCYLACAEVVYPSNRIKGHYVRSPNLHGDCFYVLHYQKVTNKDSAPMIQISVKIGVYKTLVGWSYKGVYKLFSVDDEHTYIPEKTLHIPCSEINVDNVYEKMHIILSWYRKRLLEEVYDSKR